MFGGSMAENDEKQSTWLSLDELSKHLGSQPEFAYDKLRELRSWDVETKQFTVPLTFGTWSTGSWYNVPVVFSPKVEAIEIELDDDGSLENVD
jgi:hypothetical protein